MDAEWFHVVIGHSQNNGVNGNSIFEKAHRSIVLIIPKGGDGSPCGSGTGFIIRPGYVATNAHVIECGLRYEDIVVKDFKGKLHAAKIEGIARNYKKANDLAILKIPDTTLPPLVLADSAIYESGHEGEEIVAIGYPLLGMASSADKPALTDKGSISTFKPDENIFIASGMPLNAGNSGGPIFLAKTQQVIGVAVAVLRGQVQINSAPVEGVSFFIPANILANFFEEKTGEMLPDVR
ncbi:MAG: hypothetical protein OMM_04063 [Candidatus Magnetoglobus multicellularis str. Araruama]|uniref:Serine protease n=1 Tax=Candidatus Magnetoglobus multicellularis str. Araruama TaxID=890399 RepID=A0A1V1P350_9BACT|nr:MAG: hypothetical protein OMM_04063 [Candidatus Magnetoglobus multicellularis str. Araruama]